MAVLNLHHLTGLGCSELTRPGRGCSDAHLEADNATGRLAPVFYVIPALILAAAVAWAVATPTTECVSGGDTSLCGDKTAIKQVVLGGALALAALTALIIYRMRRRHSS
jgi:hypothetical protein